MHKEFMKLSDDIHRYIVLELFLKTLERDRECISELKMRDVVEEWYDSKINETFHEFKKLRDFLYKQGCKIEKQKSDDFMTYYFILFRGYDEIRSYGNIALRNWVSEEMKRILGMKYLTPADKK
ncbi:hypothetical protein SSIL_1886 [Solibacillus silvestris StLB046]|uniref:Uncharacterized protein n=1 Tax=Solibacillus silvestris (strain StLB046) TaxID=1002809 RepID=F2F0R5_SOLSS|nr:hypothetical protein [Solibacillus silvestris]OBW60274.1 hypothetical protein A9986_03615 [Solibacillus silvestris]BAK16309.1 hypothetical protein SSIL_1886 [Solibacillus silvestris StLB046]